MNDLFSPALADALRMALWLGAELSLLFLLISFGVKLLQSRLPQERVRDLIGQGRAGYLKAALLGAVTPFCSCSTIPLLAGLLKARVAFGPTLAFLFVSPLLNPIVVGLLLLTFGFKVTAVYVAATLVISLAAAHLLDRAGFARYVRSAALGATPAVSCCTTPAAPAATSCCAPAAPAGNAGRVASGAVSERRAINLEVKPAASCCVPVAAPKPNAATSCCAPAAAPAAPAAAPALPPRQPLPWRAAWRDALGQLRSVAPYLAAGVAIGALSYGFVPTDLLEQIGGPDQPWAIPLAAVIGIPLYLRAEALIPIAAALGAKGLGTGPLIALIIGGAGASLTELVLLRSLFRLPVVVALAAVVISIAVAAGFALELVGS